jgi:uncharacterized protein YyaL (SSP411 family)
MNIYTHSRAVLVAELCLILVGCSSSTSPGGSTTPTTPATPPASTYLTMAQATHEYIISNLLTSYGSYEIEPGSDTSYAWYDGSQIYADAAMIAVANEATYAPYMNNTYTWMGNIWDIGSMTGGYWAAAAVNGSKPGGGQYVDDNSLIGLAYVEAYAVTTGSQKSAYLQSAEAIANWLMQSGMWDSTFGGGFWWSTAKTVKPTQSNGLAMQLFLKLYQITGQSNYKNWAQSIDSWLESTMYNSSNGLYNWEIESDGTLQTINFTYDNAIMIEAFILYSQSLGDSSYLTKAETLADSLNAVLYVPTTGVYQLNTGDAQINPTWSGWVSQSLIRLYQADNNTRWLNYAQSNIDFINKYMRNPSTGAYYQYCNIDGTGVNDDIEGVDQAWMQRIQTLLAAYR